MSTTSSLDRAVTPTDQAASLRLRPSPPGTSRLPRVLRSRPGDPAWVRPGLVALLAATALLYLWDLGRSGWANAFYASAVQAGTQSWKAFFFGSLDAGNAITVDKPPVSLWVMGLSARVFGLNSWSLLVPQALMGVASVALVYATVRRQFSAAAGLLAGAVLALTPVATLMFRFDNPDALLVLLTVGATYAMVRAVEGAHTRWLLLAAALVGTAFLTKMLQAFLVLPVFALLYVVVANTPVRRRLRQLLAAAVTLVVTSGWWIAIVDLWPASSRPYIGGSQGNSALELALGYNGLGRITGNETGSVGGGGAPGGGRWGTPGLLRLFGNEFGTQIAWLIPAALILTVALLWWSRRVSRTSAHRAQVLLWAGSLLITGLTFSLMQGIVHPYYAVALAPAIAALLGIGATESWRLRHRWPVRAVLASSLMVTSVLAWDLLSRSADWFPVLRYAVLALGAATSAALLGLPLLGRRAAPVVAAAALLVGLAGPAAYSVQTALTPHTGSLPTAGPASARGNGPGPMRFGATGRPGASPLGQPPAGGGPRTGGLLEAGKPSAAVVEALRSHASSYTWVAAAIGANNAAGYQLGTGLPVLALGGFNGTDPSPTLAQFQTWVSHGRVHWFVARGAMGGPGGPRDGSGTSARISSWVQSHFTATTIGGVTLYDLTQPRP